MQNETSNASSSLGNFGAINPNVNNNNNSNNNNLNNAMSAQQRLSQGGVGLFNQQGLMNGMIGNANSGMAANAGNLNSMGGLGAMNNMGGMANNMNLGAGSNFNAFSSMNPNANFNASDFMRLQQQLQQQRQMQQMQMQQMQQMQGSGGLNNPNFGLMAAQNQNQAGNNPSNSNMLQSMMGRNQFAGGGGLAGQTNVHQNPFLGHLMMNQMNQQQGAMAPLGTAGIMGNQGNLMGAGTGNNFQLATPNSMFSRDASRRMRGGVIEPFPEKLHRLLIEVEACGRADVISFVANGRAFAIHKADAFFKEIVPLYFRQSRLSSFKRQLNLYGFELINTGPARGGYYHDMFVKDRPELCRRMRRVAVKVAPNKDGKKKKKGGDSDENPEEAAASAAAGNEETKPEGPSNKEEATKDDAEPETKEDSEVKTEEVTTIDEAVVEQTEIKGDEKVKDEDAKEEIEVTPKKEESEAAKEPTRAEESDRKSPDKTSPDGTTTES